VNVAYDGGTALGEGGFAPGYAGKVAVKFLAGGEAVDAYIDDGCARGDHLWSDEARTADGGYQNIGLAGDFGEVSGFGVADGDRCVLVEE